MTIPLNRIVAFAGPYLSVVAGGIATWLVAKVNIAGQPGLDENNLKTSIAGGLAWLLVAGLTWAGHSKWLAGHHIQMEADAQLNAAALTAASAAPPPPPAPSVVYSNGNGNGFHSDEIADVSDIIEDPYSETMGEEDVVSDDEELAAPPPPINYVPASELELVS